MENNDAEKIIEQRTELELALYHHQQLFQQIIRSIICKIPYKNSTCQFDSTIPSINNSHKIFHQQNEKLLSALTKNNTLSPTDYDQYTQALENYKTAIYSHLKELEISSNGYGKSVARVTMLPILREQQSYAKRQSQPCSIAMIDIDLLDKINHEYGKSIGKKIQISIAEFLVENVRKYDRVFCYNNESFIVSLQQVDAKQALELIDRLRIKISKTPINVGFSQPVYVTISCGLTELSPHFTIEQSLDQANIALYLAKKSGSNNSKLWSHNTGAQ